MGYWSPMLMEDAVMNRPLKLEKRMNDVETPEVETTEPKMCCCDALVLAPYFDDRSSISTDRSSCLSWDDSCESEDDCHVPVEDELEIICEQDLYAPEQRHSDAHALEDILMRHHTHDPTTSQELQEALSTLQGVHARVYDDRCLATLRPCYIQIELVHVACAVDRIHRSRPNGCPFVDALDRLERMIHDTWTDVLGLQHLSTSRQVHYAIL
ncbi:Aste57867_22495 [Aphanomyces stellatus]|uniref:Aste57867_22495 protein n=1 Tax=Aphanomyces stellatus TaxID=120398 RepID=A0A485LM33_9STRA|nr:hypothetical protein As57867_022425 [Aphanomyces stellatus]VFT99155.1 Aste57867_22495 [Aphanomyces stellatus]